MPAAVFSVAPMPEPSSRYQVPAAALISTPALGQSARSALWVPLSSPRLAKIDLLAAILERASGGESSAVGINQVARWVQTKEAHASHIITVVSEYFLTQKVKTKAKGTAEYGAYLDSLAKHHAVMVAAMKTKQQVSSSAVHNLEHAIGALGALYAY